MDSKLKESWTRVACINMHTAPSGLLSSQQDCILTSQQDCILSSQHVRARQEIRTGRLALTMTRTGSGLTDDLRLPFYILAKRLERSESSSFELRAGRVSPLHVTMRAWPVARSIFEREANERTTSWISITATTDGRCAFRISLKFRPCA